MIEFVTTHPWSCTMAYLIACFFVWSLCAIAGQADDEAEKMGRIRRVR